MKHSNAQRATRGSFGAFDVAAARAFNDDLDVTREIQRPEKTTRLSMASSPRCERDAWSPLVAGDVVLGRYEVQRCLGRDGASSSYLARHVVTDRVVAIKVLDSEFARDASKLDQLRRDARAIGRIRSDHVVAVHDVGAEQGSPATLVIDHIEGETIERALAKGALGFDMARLFGAQLLAGLNEAHSVGIIHGNLTPRSVVIEKSAATGPRVKLLDIGLSMFTVRPEIDLECEGLPLGTVGYLSPERLIGTTVAADASEDLYAVGVMIFAMLTGLRPFQADNEAAELNNVLTRPALRVSTALGRDVPKALERFMDRALAADRDDRFQSANEMRLALFVAFDEALGARPVVSANYEDVITIVRHAPVINRVAPSATRVEAPARLSADILEDETVALPTYDPPPSQKPAPRSAPPPPPAAAIQASTARRSSTAPPLPAAALQRVSVKPAALPELSSDWAELLEVSEPEIVIELQADGDDDGDFVIPPLGHQSGSYSAAMV